MALDAGDSLLNGHYRIVRQVGRGGFGFVYEAQDTLLGETVAIKELIPALVGDETMLKRFLAEAKATMRLAHKRIVRTHNMFSEGGNYYIVMEYMPGGSLEDRLRAGGPLPPEEAVRIAAEVGEGLACAHEEGVVHCDLKPANILFAAGGSAKVADFGIAHVSDEVLSRTWQTPAGFVAGTLPYMSPEQADGLRDDPRIDVYALGAILHRMLTGRSYLGFDTRETPGAQADNVYRIRHEQPTPPSAGNPRVPPWLDQVVLKALAKRPEDRYAGIAAMRADLLQRGPSAAPGPAPTLAAARPAIVPPPGAAPGPGPRPVPAPRGRRPLPRLFWPLAGAAGLLLVLLVAAIALALAGGGLGLGSEAARQTNPPPTQAPAPTTAPGRTPTSAGPAAPPPAAAVELTCPPGDVCAHAGPDEPIVVGWMMVVSGPDASLGIDTRRGVEIAVADRGALLGHPVELVGADELCTAEGGQDAALKLAGLPQMTAIVGTNCSSAARSALPTICGAGIPLVSPSSTAPDLTSVDRPAEYWCYLRTSPNDNLQGAAMAEYAFTAGFRRAATVHDGSIYAVQLERVFADSFMKFGGEVVARAVIPPDVNDLQPLLTGIGASTPELLYYPIFVESGSQITRQARQTPGLEKTQLAGADGLFTRDFLAAAGEAALGFRWSSPDLTAFGPGYKDFVVKYETRYGESTIAPYHAHAYDATNMVLAAIEQVALQGADGSLLIPRHALHAALARTQSFPGLTGSLTCSPTGDCASPHMAIYACQDPDPTHWNPGANPDSNPLKIWP